MEKRFNDLQNNLQQLDNYMATVSPIGDWRNPVLDTPLMSRFVTNLYNVKASQSNKLAFYSDIIDSFSDIQKHQAITKEKMQGLPPQIVDIAKELVNDTINTRSESTLAFLNENLRKEFVQAEYLVTGQQPNGQQVAERELVTTGITADGICQILSNLTSIDMYVNSVNELIKRVLPNVLPMAATLKQNDPNMYNVFRQLLAATEGLSVVLSVIKGLHDGCVNIQPVANVGNMASGVVISDVVTPISNQKSFVDIQNDINHIAEVMKPFGQHVPDRVRKVLSTSANENDIEDIKNVIINTATPVSSMNAEKFALAVSTAFAVQSAPQIVVQAPKNICVAMLYISKLHADKRSGSNAQTQDIAFGFKDITGLEIQVVPGYRMSLAQAVFFDMQTGNSNAVTSLGALIQSPEMVNFGRLMLSKQVTGQPQMTKQALLQHIKTASPYNNNPTTVDVDEFMKSRHYPGNSAAPAVRQEILQAVISAINM